MNVVIYGATGFLGSNLIPTILERTSWNITAVGRNPDKIEKLGINDARLHIKKGDVSNPKDLERTLNNMDVAYYFVHMMGRKDVDFYEAELAAARTFINAVNKSDIGRVVFMGGLGDNEHSHSRHLKSRHLTGEIFRTSSDKVIELRASMIIGNGSVGYDIIRNIVHKLPVMVLPTSSNTLTQPIALSDTIDYLIAAATVQADKSLSIDIGGPDVLSYADIYRLYAEHVGKKPLLLKFPYIPQALSSFFLDIMTPKIHARIGTIMAESMSTSMTVRGSEAQQYFPDISPLPIKRAMEVA